MKVFIFGLSGRMGCALVSAAADRGYEVTGGFDRVRHPSIPTFTDAAAIDVDYDVIIDFSLPATLDALIAAATAKGVPVVIATTGYTPDEQKKIEALSRRIFAEGAFRAAEFLRTAAPGLYAMRDALRGNDRA